MTARVNFCRVDPAKETALFLLSRFAPGNEPVFTSSSSSSSSSFAITCEARRTARAAAVGFPVSSCVVGTPCNVNVAGAPPTPAPLPAEVGWTLFPAVLGGPPCCWSSIKEFRRRVWPMRMDFRCDLLRWYCPPGSSFFECACRSSCHRLLAMLGGADGEARVAGAMGAEGAEVEVGIAVEADGGPDFASPPRGSICSAGAGLRQKGSGGKKGGAKPNPAAKTGAQQDTPVVSDKVRFGSSFEFEFWIRRVLRTRVAAQVLLSNKQR